MSQKRHTLPNSDREDFSQSKENDNVCINLLWHSLLHCSMAEIPLANRSLGAKLLQYFLEVH